MILRSKTGIAKRVQRQKLPLMLIGIDPDAFISNQGWMPNLRASGCFDLRYLVSEDEVRAEAMRDEYPDLVVGSNYSAMVTHAVIEHGSKLVVAVCTPDHFNVLKYLIAVGVKKILVEKPPVKNCAQWAEINRLADEAGCVILVSFQHELNAPVDFLRKKVDAHLAEYGPDAVSICAVFFQDWQRHGTTNWRIDIEDGGNADIGTHAACLATNVAGSWIEEILSSSHWKNRLAMQDKASYDTGDVKVLFANGIKGLVQYSQAMEGFSDYIAVEATLKYPDGSVRKWAWGLVLGAGDVLLEGGPEAKLEDFRTWEKRHERGTAAFPDDINALYAKQPGGHQTAWSDMYYWFFVRAWRIFLAQDGEELADYLIPGCYGYCPTFAQAGKTSSIYIEASWRSFKEGRPVAAAELADEFGFSPDNPPIVVTLPAGCTGQTVLK